MDRAGRGGAATPFGEAPAAPTGLGTSAVAAATTALGTSAVTGEVPVPAFGEARADAGAGLTDGPGGPGEPGTADEGGKAPKAPKSAGARRGRPKTLTLVLVAVIALVIGGGGALGFGAVTAKSVSATFGAIEAVDGIYSIAPGETATATLESKPGRLFLDKLTLESSRPSVLKVTESDGQTKIEGVKTGQAQLTVKSSVRKATQTYSFNVSVPPEAIEDVPDDLVLDLDESFSLVPVVVPEESTYPVGFESSDEAVATVDGDGVVTGVSAGTAEVVVTCGSITRSIAIDVHRKVTGVTLPEEAVELVPGQTYQLEATVEPSDAADKTLKYSSSESDTVKVSAEGSVYVKWGDYGNKSATITVTSVDGPAATLDVSVSNPYLAEPESGPVDMTGTSYRVTPLAVATPIPNCTGLTVSYSIPTASSDAYLQELRNSTTFEVRVTDGSGGWDSVGTFKMDGASSTTAQVTFDARTVARIAVVPSASSSTGTGWSSGISLDGVLFAGEEAEGDT